MKPSIFLKTQHFYQQPRGGTTLTAALGEILPIFRTDTSQISVSAVRALMEISLPFLFIFLGALHYISNITKYA